MQERLVMTYQSVTNIKSHEDKFSHSRSSCFLPQFSFAGSLIYTSSSWNQEKWLNSDCRVIPCKGETPVPTCSFLRCVPSCPPASSGGYHLGRVHKSPMSGKHIPLLVTAKGRKATGSSLCPDVEREGNTRLFSPVLPFTRQTPWSKLFALSTSQFPHL